jgi:hypothetical protein
VVSGLRVLKLSKRSTIISEANQEAAKRMMAAHPVLVDIQPAVKVIPGMTEGTILHAGPPIAWDRMCNAMKGALQAAIIFEGIADSPEEALKVAKSGRMVFDPNHEHQAVGSMTGVTSPSMPVWVVNDTVYGNSAYQALDIGDFAGGNFHQKAVQYNLMVKNEIAPVLKAAITEAKGIDLKTWMAKAFHMGDELHNRCAAGTNLFAKMIMPYLLRTDFDKASLARTADYLAGGKPSELIGIFLSMVSCKVACDAAKNVKNSSIVTAMSRNGVEFGIKVSGLGDMWFTGPPNIPKGLYHPPFREENANPDIGDSAITETRGVGGFIIATAPAIMGFVGGTARDAINYTLEMSGITVARDPDFTIPSLDFQGTPVGIDVRKVVETGILPIIDTGIAHKEAGYPEIGAGLVRPPMEAFRKALKVMSEGFG